MLYVIRSDFAYFFRERKRYLFVVLLILALYPFAERMVYYFKLLSTLWKDVTMSQILIGNIGATYFTYGLSSIAFYVPFVLYTYLNFQHISCYFNYINYGPENVFLRINKTKWLICKYVSIATYTIVFQMIVYIILITVYSFFQLQFDFNQIVEIFVFDTIVKIYIGYIALALVSLFDKFGTLFMYIMLLLANINFNFLYIKILNIFYYLFAYEYISNASILKALAVFIIITMTTFVINRKAISRLFEREGLV